MGLGQRYTSRWIELIRVAVHSADHPKSMSNRDWKIRSLSASLIQAFQIDEFGNIIRLHVPVAVPSYRVKPRGAFWKKRAVSGIDRLTYRSKLLGLLRSPLIDEVRIPIY